MVPHNTTSGVAPAQGGVGPPDPLTARLALIREVRSDEYTAAVIREALDAGWSRVRIHRETGLSRDTIRDVLARTAVGD